MREIPRRIPRLKVDQLNNFKGWKKPCKAINLIRILLASSNRENSCCAGIVKP